MAKIKILVFLFLTLFAKVSHAAGNIPFLFLPIPSSSPVPRVISTAYFSSWSGTTYGSAGMTSGGYSISTAGVNNGDLLLIIANIDNGSTTLFPNPIATGFTQLSQVYYGNDGQTFTASWKIASNEPATYTGTYGSGNGSGSAVFTLIAVTGANASSPIVASSFNHQTGTGTNTPSGISSGVTTASANNLIIYAMGADWQSSSTSTISAYTLPTSYTSLMHQVDRGTGNVLDWTSLMVGYQVQSSPGATGTTTGSQSANHAALGWAAMIAIKP